MDTDSLFKTRQLTEYREWFGAKGCLFYMRDYTHDELYGEGAIFIVNTPCREYDHIGDYDILHQSEKMLLRGTLPVISGFAALLIIQDFSLVQDKYQAADDLWNDYYKEIVVSHPTWNNEVELIMQESVNCIGCNREVLTLFLGSENKLEEFMECMKHAIHTVLLRHTRSVEDSIRLFHPLIRIPKSKDYLQYEFETNKLILHSSNRTSEKKSISGWTAIHINYVAIRQIVRDFSSTTNYDKAIQFLIARLGNSIQGAIPLDMLHIPLFSAERADEIYHLALKYYKYYIINSRRTDVNFSSLPIEEQKQEILYHLFKYESEQRKSLDIIEDMTIEDKTILHDYHYAFFMNIQNSLRMNSAYYSRIAKYCSDNFEKEGTPSHCSFNVDTDKTDTPIELWEYIDVEEMQRKDISPEEYERQLRKMVDNNAHIFSDFLKAGVAEGKLHFKGDDAKQIFYSMVDHFKDRKSTYKYSNFSSYFSSPKK